MCVCVCAERLNRRKTLRIHHIILDYIILCLVLFYFITLYYTILYYIIYMKLRCVILCYVYHII